MPYRICPHCGANLDPEEKCNCQEEEDEDRSYQGTVYKELEQTLKLTRAGVESLELADEETVVIHYEGGGKRPVNIALDSATVIIRDVARVVD